jgi:hypothetical protein
MAIPILFIQNSFTGGHWFFLSPDPVSISGVVHDSRHDYLDSRPLDVLSRSRAANIESVDVHFKFAALLPIAIVTIVVANRSLLR